ncbi:unnamed protein product [Schistocephalus solidus]|uniref:26S proteasome non-ATPase regulatory subunit 9 n=1 Tax=Schistocephalus solidus TaxID=70667 RepID=A0A183TTI4_SCHSO|nr:unnamed protein product [Schistocephalus solidus]
MKQEPLPSYSHSIGQLLNTMHTGLTARSGHGVDAEDSSPLQDFHVREPVLLSQLQYSAEADAMEVIKLPGYVRVDGSGLPSVKECLQDDGLVNLQFAVHKNPVVIPHGGLKSAEGLSGFGDPLGNLVIASPGA